MTERTDPGGGEATDQAEPRRRPAVTVRPLGVLAVLAVLTVVVAAIASGSGTFPAGWRVPLGDGLDEVQDWVVRNRGSHWFFVGVLTPISTGIRALLTEIDAWLGLLGWPGVMLLIGTVATVVANWRVAVVSVTALVVIGLMGQWDDAMRTLALMSTAVAVALAIGVPLGVLSGRRPAVAATLRPLLDAMQTTPAYIYLLPLVFLFGIGDVPAVIATLIYALPPAVRLTALGIRTVPDDLLEVGRASGGTSRQLLRTVQLPTALPSIRVGINQTIMMALAMVVIGALIGGTGLGLGVLRGLQSVDVGRSLEPGVAIVLIAVVLDRITYGAGGRRRPGPTWRRPAIVAGAFVAGLGLGALPFAREVPGAGVLAFAGPVNQAWGAAETAIRGTTRAFSAVLLSFGLEPLRQGLLLIPWWLLILVVAVIAWRVVGAGVATFTVIAFGTTGALGLWPEAMNTASQLGVAAALAVAIGLPVGVAAGLSDRLERSLRPVLDTLQTMPAFVYLIPVVALFELGRVPGVIATVVYAMPPVVRLTSAGIRAVPDSLVEAARSTGATPWQLLRTLQLPVARPQILLGVNQTIMMALASIVIAGLIGAGGLGFETVLGLTRAEVGRGVEAGLVIVLLGILLDRITQALGSDDEATRATVKTA